MPDADFSLDSVSVLLVWTAIAIYTMASIRQSRRAAPLANG